MSFGSGPNQPGFGPPQQSGAPFNQPFPGQGFPPPKPSGSGCFTGCLIAFFVALGIGVLGCAGAFFYGYYYGPAMVAGFAESTMIAAIDQSELDADQKAGLKENISRVTRGVKEGKITLQEIGEFFEKVEASPVGVAISLAFLAERLDTTELDKDQIAKGKMTLARVATGVLEGKITKEAARDAISSTIGSEHAGGFKDKKASDEAEIDDEEFEALIEKCEKLADDANVDKTVTKVDFAGELKRLVDASFGKKGI